TSSACLLPVQDSCNNRALGSLDEQNPQVAILYLARSGLFQHLLGPKRCVTTSFKNERSLRSSMVTRAASRGEVWRRRARIATSVVRQREVLMLKKQRFEVSRVELQVRLKSEIPPALCAPSAQPPCPAKRNTSAGQGKALKGSGVVSVVTV